MVRSAEAFTNVAASLGDLLRVPAKCRVTIDATLKDKAWVLSALDPTEDVEAVLEPSWDAAEEQDPIDTGVTVNGVLGLAVCGRRADVVAASAEFPGQGETASLDPCRFYWGGSGILERGRVSSDAVLRPHVVF
jgi:hypothetical protein